MKRWITAVIVGLLSLTFAARSTAQQVADSARIRKTPAPYASPSSGRAMYIAYCASCHGSDGKGGGPVASAMRVPPTDLTQLAAANGGRFPEKQVIQTINGDSAAPSHGSKDMPVWGPILRSMGTASDGTAQLRVRNLAKYISSLQSK